MAHARAAGRSRQPRARGLRDVPWIVEEEAGADHWGGYPEERPGLADHIASHGIDNLVMLAGDAHMLAFDDGSNSDYASAGRAGFPVIHAGALDRPGSTKGGPYSEGAIPGAGQFVLMTVLDDGGPEVLVRWSGRDWTGAELMALAFTIPAREVGADLRAGATRRTRRPSQLGPARPHARSRGRSAHGPQLGASRCAAQSGATLRPADI